jgi:hypothetical protein
MTEKANIRFLRLLRGNHGFQRALRFVKEGNVTEDLCKHGVKDTRTKLHCNALFLVLMKRPLNQMELDAKDDLIMFLLHCKLSVLLSGVDHVGDSCLKYMQDLSPITFSALLHVYLSECKSVYPSEYILFKKKNIRMADLTAAKILTDMKVY